VIGTFDPWGQNVKDGIEFRTASASSFQIDIMTGAGNDSMQLAAVVPPYIILGDRIDVNGPLYRHLEIRLSLNDMEGFYSEARATNLASSKQPIMLGRSTGLFAFSELRLSYAD